MKKQIVIKMKMSNTGSIYDIESDLFDRIIDMTHYDYTIVLPAFYGGHTRHKSFDRALQQYKRMSNMNYYPQVLDANGHNQTEMFVRKIWSTW